MKHLTENAIVAIVASLLIQIGAILILWALYVATYPVTAQAEDIVVSSSEASVSNSVQVEETMYSAYTRLKAELKANYNIDINLLDSTADYRLLEEQQAIFTTLSIVFLVPGADGTSTAVIPDPVFAKEHPDLIRPFLDLLPENGFIVRFPPGKEPLTGVPGTYQDICFVGSARLAKTLTATDSCLEEYIAGRNP